MSATVTFLREAQPVSQPERVLAPAAAIAQREGKKVAFVVDQGRVRRVGVETGAAQGPSVVVESGLAGGEVVVLSPPAGLADGDRVKMITKE